MKAERETFLNALENREEELRRELNTVSNLIQQIHQSTDVLEPSTTKMSAFSSAKRSSWKWSKKQREAHSERMRQIARRLKRERE